MMGREHGAVPGDPAPECQKWIEQGERTMNPSKSSESWPASYDDTSTVGDGAAGAALRDAEAADMDGPDGPAFPILEEADEEPGWKLGPVLGPLVNPSCVW